MRRLRKRLKEENREEHYNEEDEEDNEEDDKEEDEEADSEQIIVSFISHLKNIMMRCIHVSRSLSNAEVQTLTNKMY